MAPRECGCLLGVRCFHWSFLPPFSARQRPLVTILFPREDDVSTILIHVMPPSTQTWDTQLPTKLTVTWMRWCSGVYRWLKRAWYRTWALLYWSKSAAGCNRTNHPIKRKVSQCWQNVHYFKNWIMGIWDPLYPSLLLCIFLRFHNT